VINPDAQHLDAKIPELLMVVPPGRQVRNSCRTPIGMVELKQHQLLPPKIAEPDLPARGSRELEIRRPVTHLHRRGPTGQGQHCHKRDGR